MRKPLKLRLSFVKGWQNRIIFIAAIVILFAATIVSVRRRTPTQTYFIAIGCVNEAPANEILRPSLPLATTQRESFMFPEWLTHACPEVVRHFRMFPYFTHYVEPSLPVFTTLAAAQAVCGVKIALDIAASVGYPIYLHAGSHLGAVFHGGPVPWDDDVDLFLPHGAIDAFLRRCNGNDSTFHADNRIKFPHVRCIRSRKFIKLYMDSPEATRTGYPWKHPFVDIFSYTINGDHIVEVNTDGSPRRVKFLLTGFYPTRPYYFGGITVFGPQKGIVLDRYTPEQRYFSEWNHRLEEDVNFNGSRLLDCCELSRHLPFVYHAKFISNGHHVFTLPFPLK